MPPAAASERDHDVLSPAVQVQRQKVARHLRHVIEQAPGGGLLHDELRDGGVAPRQVPQLGHPVGIVEKPDVDDDGGVGGGAVLVAERETCDQGSFAAAQVLDQLAAP